MGLTIHVLGSGTVVPDHRHFPAAHLLEGDGVLALLDCGAGALARISELGVAWARITHVVLTHHHDDHVGGLKGLFQAWKYGMEPPRREPVELVGPPGTRDLLDRMGALEPHLAGLDSFACRVRELGDGEGTELGPWRIEARDTPHTPESVAFRVETAAGAVGFTGDTGPSDAVAAFLAGCRVVVAECSWRDPLPVPLHLSPATLAEMAAIIRPELLVVTHVYPTHMTPDEAVRGIAAAGYDGAVIAARDGMRIAVEEGAVAVDPGGTRQ